MNKAFWDSMVSVWCHVVSTINSDIIKQFAKEHVEADKKVVSGYSINPLDDDDDEEDDWD